MDLNVIIGLLDSVDAAWVTARAGSAGIDDLVGLVASVLAGAVLGWMGLLTVLTAAARIPGLAGGGPPRTPRSGSHPPWPPGWFGRAWA